VTILAASDSVPAAIPSPGLRERPADLQRREEIREALVDYPADEPPLAALRSGLMDIADGMVAAQDDTQLRMQLLREYPVLLPRHMANLAAFERSLVDGIAGRTGTNPEVDVYPGLPAPTAAAITPCPEDLS
jgi:hypothetical protein